MRILFIAILSFLFCIKVFSQDNDDTLDSLLQEFNNADHDTSRIKLCFEIGDYCEYEMPDSAIYFYKQALKISKSVDDELSEAKALLYIGYVLQDNADYVTPLNYYRAAIKLLLPDKNLRNLAGAHNSTGNCYYQQGDYEKALENMLKALGFYEEMKKRATSHIDKYKSLMGISAVFSNIGCVHTDLENYNSALDYHNKSLAIYNEVYNLEPENEKRSGKNGISICYINIGNVYHYQGNYQQALDYYTKALQIKKELGDQRGICLANNNMGNIYGLMGEYNKAIETYNISLSNYQAINDTLGISLVNGNICAFYVLLADSMNVSQSAKENYLHKAIKYGLESYNNATIINSLPQINESASHLRRAYKKIGDLSNAYLFSEIYIESKDTLYQEEKGRAIAEMETKYQSEKKQLKIEKLGKEKELQTSEMKKQRIMIFSFLAVLILVIIFSIFLYRLLLQKKKANLIIAQKNQSLRIAFTEINNQKEEITTQRDQIVDHRDRLSEQNSVLSEQKKEITDSINYAKRIQQAILPNFLLLFGNSDQYNVNMPFADYFALFKPKDIVSGDFYWAAKTNDWLIVAVADCTGHGVPGAFMSMLGISFLNEIVRKKDVTNAAEVLNQLRASIIEALKQSGETAFQQTSGGESMAVKDGMDMSIIAIKNSISLNLSRTALWAGANNPLWIIRNRNVEALPADNPEIIEEIKGDKQPVSIHIKMEPFTNHELQLEKGDQIYLFTDGYPDQFGGPKGKKFKYKPFKNLLVENAGRPMSEQKQALEIALDAWMFSDELILGESYSSNSYERKSFEQVDDITIVGIRI